MCLVEIYVWLVEMNDAMCWNGIVNLRSVIGLEQERYASLKTTGTNCSQTGDVKIKVHTKLFDVELNIGSSSHMETSVDAITTRYLNYTPGCSWVGSTDNILEGIFCAPKLQVTGL